MRGKQSRVIIRNQTILPILLLIFSGSISQASAQSTVTPQASVNSSPGWIYVQDSPLVFCSPGPRNGCNIGPGNMAPTVAGSVWVLQMQSTNNVTMSSVTGGGGTWVHCPNCHGLNPSSLNTDAWYNLSGNAGTSQGISVTLSGSSGTVFGLTFIEMLPPAGSTASYDDSGTAAPTNCMTCTSVALNVTATDVIIHTGAGPNLWNAWSAPYLTDSNADGIGLNVSSGAAPTITFTRSVNPIFMAIAFKSSLGTFTPSATHQYSLVNYTVYNPPTSCGTCTIPIPATGANHLLFIESADEINSHIASVSGAGTWVVPSGANTCQDQQAIGAQTGNAASCAYNLSSTAGVTSLTVTMSGSGTTNFAVYEVASASGNFAFDTQGSINYTANTVYANGPTLTLSGQNDVIFSMNWCVGGSNGPTFFPQPMAPFNNTMQTGPFNYYLTNEAASTVLLDSGKTPPVPVWINPQNTPTFVTGIAFTAASTSAMPNPPTGLTAIVH